MKLSSILSALFGVATLVSTVHAEVDANDYGNWYAHPQMIHGDFDGDGNTDLVVGRPHGGSGLASHLGGELFLYLGNSNRSPILSIYDDTFPWDDAGAGGVLDYDDRRTLAGILPVSVDSFFGASMAVGDYNEDGFQDLAAGVPGASAGGSAHAGQVLVFWGANNPLTTFTAIHQGSPEVSSEAELNDFFGHALETGDFNCDGVDDLAVGAPFENYDHVEDAGYAYVFYGEANDKDIDRRSHGQKFFQRQFEGERERSNEKFGFALAAGQFSRFAIWGNCQDLAVGAPGDYGGRGKVFVYHNAINQPEIHLNNTRLKEVLTQGTDGLEDAEEWGEGFGAILGKLNDRDHRWYDYLYVGSPGEDTSDTNPTTHPMRQPPLRCTALGRTYYHVLESHDGGFARSDGRVSATSYCGFFPPDLFERTRGVVHELRTELGGVSFYIPASFTGRYSRPSAISPTSAALLLHGRPAPSGEPNGCSATGNRLLRASGPGLTHHFRWQEVADNTGHVLVSPAIWAHYFATQSSCTGMGVPLRDFGYGFEGLIGSDGSGPYMLYQYLLDIMDDLERVGLTTVKFRAYGHSGGGRALTRFLWLFPLRMERVLISAPGSYLNNLPNATWPEGLGVFDEALRFAGWDRSQRVRIDPGQATQGMTNDEWWRNAVLDRPIDIVVGADETLMKHYLADSWAHQFNVLAGHQLIRRCAVNGCGHSSRCMSRVSANRLLRSSGSVDGPAWIMGAACVQPFPNLYRSHCDVAGTPGGDFWTWDNPGESNCTDNLDNDCDGNGSSLIDGADPDCP